MLIPTRSRNGAPTDADQPLRLLDDPKPRADRAFGVVLVRCGHAEHADDGIADELLDHAAVCLDLRPHNPVVRRQSRSASSGSATSEDAVNPTRSQNSEVTTFRSSRADPTG